jgi:hypothetical protein
MGKTFNRGTAYLRNSPNSNSMSVACPEPRLQD